MVCLEWMVCNENYIKLQSVNMLMVDDYELLPRDEIEHLRNEIQKLKGKPLGADSDTVIGSIRQLQKSIDALVKVFGDANEILKHTTSENSLNYHSDALTRLERQNEKIARSMVSLANTIKTQNSRPQIQPQNSRPQIQPQTGLPKIDLAKLQPSSQNAPKEPIQSNPINKSVN